MTMDFKKNIQFKFNHYLIQINQLKYNNKIKLEFLELQNFEIMQLYNIGILLRIILALVFILQKIYILDFFLKYKIITFCFLPISKKNTNML